MISRTIKVGVVDLSKGDKGTITTARQEPGYKVADLHLRVKSKV